MSLPNIAVLGATGVVGREIIKISEELNVEYESIRFFSSKKSAIYGYTFHMSFAENVKSEIEYQDIQIKELAFKTGISRSTLTKYLSGKESQPGVENAVKIARALNVSVEKLVTGKEDISKDLNDETNDLLHDIRHLSTEDFKIAKNNYSQIVY